MTDQFGRPGITKRPCYYILTETTLLCRDDKMKKVKCPKCGKQVYQSKPVITNEVCILPAQLYNTPRRLFGGTVRNWKLHKC